MVNSWSLAYEELYGDIDKEYPIINKELKAIEEAGGFEWTPGSPWPPNLNLDDIMDEVKHSKYYYDYDRNDPDMPDPFAVDPLSDNDDQIAHHIGLNNEVEKQGEEKPMANYFKYHEDEILKDIEEYVSGTYRGHYTGDTHEYRNVQTIDLMAARSLASGFCQSNILKYGSRYGSKDGKNKKDLLKVIHYAMLLLHFDEHYGKPSITSGNIDHNMP